MYLEVSIKGLLLFHKLDITNLKERTLLINWLNFSITEAENQNKITIIMGDFNEIANPSIDCTIYRQHNNKREIINMLKSYNFTDTFREIHLYKKDFTYTRPNKNYGSRIDYI